ncbi:hypothetical protein JFL47_03290 [Haemophilus haemoglobinophilus]|nr:hypothetical protein [Canicola haemoglobinophilus]
MSNKASEIIKCPFCFTESERGISVCRGCQATVKYEESILPILPYFIISLVVGLIGGFYLLRFLGEHIFTSIQHLSGTAGWTLFGIIVTVLFSLTLYTLLIYVRSPDAKNKVIFNRYMPK